MIYCIWYPSGGFGHYINAVISLHGENFVRPANKNLKFSPLGNSHDLELSVRKWHFSYDYNFTVPASSKHYSVLVDTGISHDNNTKFINDFNNPYIIKVCYTDWSWAIMLQTSIIKGIKEDFDTHLGIDHLNFDWEKREQIFLALLNSPIRNKWRDNIHGKTLLIDDLLDYNVFKSKLLSFGIKTDDFYQLWESWYQVNYNYFSGYLNSKKVLDAIKNKTNMSLDMFTSITDQAILYYFIWLEYNLEVPHNTFSNFFEDTNQITKWINQSV
jgi:hypothetical protein